MGRHADIISSSAYSSFVCERAIEMLIVIKVCFNILHLKQVDVLATAYIEFQSLIVTEITIVRHSKFVNTSLLEIIGMEHMHSILICYCSLFSFLVIKY